MNLAQITGPNDIIKPLEPRHRDAMLDLVLAWASLDGALGMLYSRVADVPMHERADLVSRKRNSDVMARIIKKLKEAPNSDPLRTKIQSNKRKLEKYSTPRNLIAHSKCVGFSKHDNDFIVFATFERMAANQLAVDCIPVQEMRHVTEWAIHFQKLIMEVVDLNGLR